MNNDEISYCISKQLPRATALQTDYGQVQLDDEMKSAVEQALKPILEKRRNDQTENT